MFGVYVDVDTDRVSAINSASRFLHTFFSKELDLICTEKRSEVFCVHET